MGGSSAKAERAAGRRRCKTGGLVETKLTRGHSDTPIQDRTSLAKAKGVKIPVVSASAAALRACVTINSQKRRRSLGSSVKKAAIEPHPESLLIEPIERPALLSTIPPDWMLDKSP